MKLLCLLLMAATAHCATPPDADLTRLLSAIAAKENQRQDAIGPHGERSIWGITKQVWDDHFNTKDEYAMGFELCTTNPFLARACAIAHLNWLANELAKAHIAPDTYALGAAWHEGLAGFIKLHAAGKVSLYGQEIANLYGAP